MLGHLFSKREVFWSFSPALPPASQNSYYTWKKWHPVTPCPFSINSIQCSVPVSSVTARRMQPFERPHNAPNKKPLQIGKSRTMVHLNYPKTKMRLHSSTYIQNKEHHVAKSHQKILPVYQNIQERSVQLNYHYWQLMGMMWCYGESTKKCWHTWGNFKEMFPWFIRIRRQLVHLTALQ